LNCTLGCNTLVDVGRNALEGDVVFCECQFNVVGAFVVNDVQLRCVSVLLQLFICTFSFSHIVRPCLFGIAVVGMAL